MPQPGCGQVNVRSTPENHYSCSGFGRDVQVGLHRVSKWYMLTYQYHVHPVRLLSELYQDWSLWSVYPIDRHLDSFSNSQQHPVRGFTCSTVTMWTLEGLPGPKIHNIGVNLFVFWMQCQVSPKTLVNFTVSVLCACVSIQYVNPWHFLTSKVCQLPASTAPHEVTEWTAACWHISHTKYKQTHISYHK